MGIVQVFMELWLNEVCNTIISSNAIELELPSTIKIYPVVNVSRVQRYKLQVEGQRKEVPQPVVIKGEEEWEVEKIMNKRKV